MYTYNYVFFLWLPGNLQTKCGCWYHFILVNVIIIHKIFSLCNIIFNMLAIIIHSGNIIYLILFISSNYTAWSSKSLKSLVTMTGKAITSMWCTSYWEIMTSPHIKFAWSCVSRNNFLTNLSLHSRHISEEGLQNPHWLHTFVTAWVYNCKMLQCMWINIEY